MWGPVTNPTARALVSWLCPLWGRHVGARGGYILPWCEASGVGPSPTPDRSSFGACGRGPLPTGCGCGGMQAWGFFTNCTARALVSSLCALWGRHDGTRGGAPLAWVWGVRGWALSHPRPLVFWGVRPGPTTHWLWVRGLRALGPGCPWHSRAAVLSVLARFPGSRHPLAVAAWHLSSCCCCGWLRASLACLVAPRLCAAPRPVWSLPALQLFFPSPWCLLPPRGRHWVAAPGTWRPAENRRHCA